MTEIIKVIYSEQAEDNYTHKFFSKSDRRSATAFAKSISKETGRQSSIYMSKGHFFGGEFYTSEATFIASYHNGKRK